MRRNERSTCHLFNVFDLNGSKKLSKMLNFILLFLSSCSFIVADFDFDEIDSRSSVTYEFSFLLPGNARDCFYQHITTGSKLKFSFEASFELHYFCKIKIGIFSNCSKQKNKYQDITSILLLCLKM